MSDFDYVLKIVMVGDGGVGKSSLLAQYFNGNFTEDISFTIGVAFHQKVLTVPRSNGNSIKVKVVFWDTAGTDRFRTLQQSYYRGAQAVMLIFDVTSQQSFDNLQNWLQEIHEFFGKGNALFKIVIGNKTDSTRVVSRDIAEEWATEHGMEYMEISAKNKEGVSNIFYHTVSSVLKDSSIVLPKGTDSFKSSAITNSKSKSKKSKKKLTTKDMKTCIPGWSITAATFSFLWFLAKVLLISSSLYILEIYYLRPAHEALYFPSSIPPYLAKAYGYVFLVNMILTVLILASLQCCIIQARFEGVFQQQQQAKKDDEEEEEEEENGYIIPIHMNTEYRAQDIPSAVRYAACLQRIAQPAYLSFPSFAFLSLIGALKYPLAVTGGGLVWNLILVYKMVEVMILFRHVDHYSNTFQDTRMSTGTWGMVLVQAIFAGLTTAHMIEYL